MAVLLGRLSNFSGRKRLQLRLLIGLSGETSDDLVVIGVVPDPEPEQSLRNFDRQGPMKEPDTRRMELADLLQAESWMPGIRLQEHEVLVGKFTDGFRQGTIRLPKPRGRKMLQISRALPAL